MRAPTEQIPTQACRELLSYLLDEEREGDIEQDCARSLQRWVAESKRFLAFVEANRAKIRKKLRLGFQQENLESVLLELEIAYRLLHDRRCEVEYERFGQGKVRRPDLTLTFRANTTVHFEATLLQAPTGTQDWEGKLIGVVCHKLSQLAAGDANILVVSESTSELSSAKVAEVMKILKTRMERRDEALLARAGIGTLSDFFKSFQWLSGIALWGSGAGVALWLNPQAKRPVPAAIAKLLVG